MHDMNEHHLPDDFEPVESSLRAHRASAEPLELDRLKRRVLRRHVARRGRWAGMRSRVAAVLTVVGLVAGSGGALAVAGGSSGGSASVAQYCHKDKEHGKCDKGKDKRHDDKKKHCKKGEEKKHHKCDRRKPDKKHDK
jgi:hypothetical protein